MDKLDTTIIQVIRSVMPNGTRNKGTWDLAPRWPPDLFAVVATITEQSGLYSEPVFNSYWHAPDFEATEARVKEVCALGEAWANSKDPPSEVRRLWNLLVTRYRDSAVNDASRAALAWKKIIFKLVAIADESCAGIGFAPPPVARGVKRPVRTFTEASFDEAYRMWTSLKRGRTRMVRQRLPLPYLPHSLCWAVPPEIACVQPKSSTPLVGCTLRSMTHHLALLPSSGTVATHWHVLKKATEALTPLNVLVVPYPFELPSSSFIGATDFFPGSTKDGTFSLDPGLWMGSLREKEFVAFICDLIEGAKLEAGEVHAVILPETALRLQFAANVAKLLARKTKLDLFVTGAISGEGKEVRNIAAMFHFQKDRKIVGTFQSKHHRWCLNGDQIKRYNLGRVLDPGMNWWERIDVSYRNCYVAQFRSGATLSVLVCEDLARYDPVLTVMNAMGPNLVVALLMDGPQLERRWPGRYATALAEDPGSAVLTLTSAGMVKRAYRPGQTQNHTIALWKERNGMAEELVLPKGDHALLLTLTNRAEEQITLDNRSDGKNTVNFALGAAHGIRCSGSHPKVLGFVP